MHQLIIRNIYCIFQQYSYDTSTATDEDHVDHQLIVDLRDMLDTINPLIAQLRMAGEQFVHSNERNKLKLRLLLQENAIEENTIYQPPRKLQD